jgi:hypothetical protein
MRGLRIWHAVLALLAAITVTRVDAVLISGDDPVFGADQVTFDTDTGLYWLDLDVTTGQSLNAIGAQLGAGGTLDGWRFATADEVSQLWTAAGVPLPIPAPGFPTFVFGSAQNTAALQLNALLDSQWDTAEETRSLGYVFELSTVSPFWWQIDAALLAESFGSTSSSFLIATFDTPSPVIGAYLVRTTLQVPEPGTLSLLLAVGAGLFWFRRVLVRRRLAKHRT